MAVSLTFSQSFFEQNVSPTVKIIAIFDVIFESKVTLKEYSSLQDNLYNVRFIHTVLIVHNDFAPRGVDNVLISESVIALHVH